MFYLETIKKLFASVKNDSNIPDDEKEEAMELLRRLFNLLAFY
jgi:hypothetical protein